MKNSYKQDKGITGAAGKDTQNPQDGNAQRAGSTEDKNKLTTSDYMRIGELFSLLMQLEKLERHGENRKSI